MINTPLGTFPKGAQCTPPEGTTTTFTWKIGGSPAVSGNCVDCREVLSHSTTIILF